VITFILPGYSLRNKNWLEETASALKTDGFVRPIFWDHWIDPSQKFDAKEKADLISRHAKGDSINIIAKSIGTLVTAHIINQIPKQIHKVIVCGIPLRDISDNNKEIIKQALESLDSKKVICFQNINDPHGTFDEVKSFLSEKIKVVSKDRADHDYPFFDIFNNFLIS
jgi:predicted alpha/beta-hydrolase family hydrolase